MSFKVFLATTCRHIYKHVMIKCAITPTNEEFQLKRWYIKHNCLKYLKCLKELQITLFVEEILQQVALRDRCFVFQLTYI